MVLLVVLLTLVLSRMSILLLERVVLMAIGHSCHAIILVLVTLSIHVHVVAATLSSSFVVVELAHQKTQRSDQTKHIGVV